MIKCIQYYNIGWYFYMNRKPNILLINCDDLGYGDLGCYGSRVNRTPAVDYLADNGLKFTDFYMASPVCSPSRGGMLTGCYPKRIGFDFFETSQVLMPGQELGLNSNEKTIASLLHDAGYTTMIVGKWHCGDQPEFLPTRHGFDYYYGLPYSNDMGRQINGKRVGVPPLPLMLNDEVIEQQPDLASLTERYVEHSIRFIRENKDKPLFLYFAHMYVHLPLYAQDKFQKQSQNGDYGAAVGCVDWSTSALLAELRRCGLEEDTLIIFTSDNGSKAANGGSNAPLAGKKTTTWEGGQRVPCIMYQKNKIQGGRVCSDIVTSLDFLPTLTSIGGGVIPQNRIIDGIDMSEVIYRGKPSPRNSFFYYKRNNLEAVRCGKWKLHVRKGPKEVRLLFDLENDVGETDNLYAQYPDVVAELNKMLEDCRVDLGDDATGIAGRNIREIGRVKNPVTLTQYDPDYPYFADMYDKEDIG